MSNNKNIVVDVRGVSKRYCRNLKRAMRYGLQDFCSDMLMRPRRKISERRPGEMLAVKNLSFKMGRGECVGLIGPNGAGKSTLLKMLAGILKPDGGRIRLKGQVGALLELHTGLSPVLSGRENAYIKGAMFGLTKKDIDAKMDEIIDFAGAKDFIDAPVKTYSSGEKGRLGFSVAMNFQPELLLIDEVLATGDLGFKFKCFDHLQKLVSTGMSIILVSHMVARIPRLCERTIVMDKGRIAFDGETSHGIAVYQELVGASEENKKKRKIEEKGIPDARIVKATVLNAAGEEAKEFQTDDLLRVRIELQAEKRLTGMRMSVGILNSVVKVAGMATPYTDFQFDLEKGKTVLEYEIPKLPLLVGFYQFNLGLFGPELIDFYDRSVSAASFSIIGPSIDASANGINGFMKIEHQWKKV